MTQPYIRMERRDHLTPVGLLQDATPPRTLEQAQFEQRVAMLEREVRRGCSVANC